LIRVWTGAASQGQGHATVFSQIVADELGVDPSLVDVIGGDTMGVEKGWGTVASRSAVVAGNAIGDAAAEIREQVLDVAGQMLEAAVEDLMVVDGCVQVRGAADRSIGLAAVAARAPELGVVLSAERYFEPPTVTWANGVHAATVEVDLDTGVIEILRYAVVHDCGTVINPTIVDGQVRGGVAQGIGGALFEEIVYSDDAQLLTATLADYLIPTSGEVPPVVLEHLETPSPANPRGIKGVGEGGAIPGAAVIANAVDDALFDLGVRVRRTPLSPLAVRTLLEEAGAG
jgi:carbon-monoxide dehydrogenase large subunit